MATDGQQSLPAGFAHSQTLAVDEQDGAFPAPFAEDFADLLYVDDGRAVDTDKFLRVEDCLKPLDRLAQQQSALSNVQTAVIICGFNPFDVVYGDEGILGPVRNQQSFWKLHRRSILALQSCKDGSQGVMRGYSCLRK